MHLQQAILNWGGTTCLSIAGNVSHWNQSDWTRWSTPYHDLGKPWRSSTLTLPFGRVLDVTQFKRNGTCRYPNRTWDSPIIMITTCHPPWRCRTLDRKVNMWLGDHFFSISRCPGRRHVATKKHLVEGLEDTPGNDWSETITSITDLIPIDFFT